MFQLYKFPIKSQMIQTLHIKINFQLQEQFYDHEKYIKQIS